MNSASQWWRDAVHVSRRLRGVLPPPVTMFARASNAREGALASPKMFGEREAASPSPSQRRNVWGATLSGIDRATNDAVTLRLSLDDAAATPMRVDAGQFVTLSVSISGAVHRRNYSLASRGGLLSELSITVKRVSGGLVSTHLTTKANVGDRFELEGPHGAFVRRADHRGPLVLVAAGSGITPVLSILKTALASTSDARVALLYGNRSREDVIFRDELDALARAHPGLHVHHVLERRSNDEERSGERNVDRGGTPERAVRVTGGRLDEETIAAWLAESDLAREPDAHFFVCGPQPVRENARRVLERLGAADRTFEERYTTGTDVPASLTPVLVELRSLSGRRETITLQPAETLLQGAARAGLSPPFSCGMGGCGECKMKLISGEIVMDEPNCLMPAERERGFILGCIARPVATNAEEERSVACVVEVRA